MRETTAISHDTPEAWDFSTVLRIKCMRLFYLWLSLGLHVPHPKLRESQPSDRCLMGDFPVHSLGLHVSRRLHVSTELILFLVYPKFSCDCFFVMLFLLFLTCFQRIPHHISWTAHLLVNAPIPCTVTGCLQCTSSARWFVNNNTNSTSYTPTVVRTCTFVLFGCFTFKLSHAFSCNTMPLSHLCDNTSKLWKMLNLPITP